MSFRLGRWALGGAEQVVFMGRTPYAGGWFESPQDHEAVARAMELVAKEGLPSRGVEQA